MAKKNLVSQTLVNMASADIKSLKAKEAKAMVREAREAIAKATAALEKASYTKTGKQSPTFYSASYENLNEWIGEHFRTRSTAPSKLKRVDAIAELQAYKKFFGAKSSTVAGARDIMLQQDIRIFGADKSGKKPIKRMTRKERENFWSLYDEFLTSDTYAALGYANYPKLQQEIGKIIKQRRRDPETGKFVGFDLGKAMKELSVALGGDEYDTSDNDILTGRGSDL